MRPAVLSAIALGSGAAVAWVRSDRPSLRVTRYRIPWPGLKRPHRVLQVSDVHVGWTTPQALMQDVVEAAHREKPDVVTLTGDYVNVSKTFFSRMTTFVSELPHPVVAVLGNHDHFVGARAIAQGLAEAGARVLRNESCVVGELVIVGVDDGFTGHDKIEEAFLGLVHPRNTLVLTHFPPTAEQIVSIGGRLVLAGHTHAGQFQVSEGWSRTLHSLLRLGKFVRGFYPLRENAQLYVNAGLGHAWRGMRWGELCRPELAVFDLVPSGEP